MPIYEFRCQACEKKSSVLVRKLTVPNKPVCPACGSHEMTRLISGFAYHKSLQTIHEESGEPSGNAGDDYYKDPRNIGRWTEKKFQQMGLDMPAEIKEEIDAAREGELPKSLKEKL